jgi:hypothetical protein
MYVVWTQVREHQGPDGSIALGPDTSTLWRTPSDNVLMVKVSYWLGR